MAKINEIKQHVLGKWHSLTHRQKTTKDAASPTADAPGHSAHDTLAPPKTSESASVTAAPASAPAAELPSPSATAS